MQRAHHNVDCALGDCQRKGRHDGLPFLCVTYMYSLLKKSLDTVHRWGLEWPPVVAPIVGATKSQHLDDAAGALVVKLTPEEVAELEVPYVPHPIVGHV
jgi:aryl-alcohol dehydrogenase-like predicted oxidoreductase